MTLRVLIDGRPVEIDVTRDGSVCRFTVLVDGTETRSGTASLVEIGAGVYSVLLGDRSYDVRVEPGDGSSFVSVFGKRFAVRVEDPRRVQRESSGFRSEDRERICAPMPGRVVRLLVAEGERVETGQGIVVVEAMKMQNEMKAPKSGRVVSLAVKEGDAVAAGETLAEVE